MEIDLRNEKIGFKIREAQMQKIPYMLVLGDKEAENGIVAVRSRKGALETMTYRRAPRQNAGGNPHQGAVSLPSAGIRLAKGSDAPGMRMPGASER